MALEAIHIVISWDRETGQRGALYMKYVHLIN